MGQSLRDRLAGWADWDEAAHALAACLGLVPAGSAMARHKSLYWSAGPAGDGLRACLDALAAAGVLERRDEPDTQYRWAVTDAEPGAAADDGGM